MKQILIKNCEECQFNAVVQGRLKNMPYCDHPNGQFLIENETIIDPNCPLDDYKPLDHPNMRLVMLHYDAIPILIEFVKKCCESTDETVRIDARHTLKKWDMERTPIKLEEE